MAVDLSRGSTAFPRALEVRQKLYDGALAGQSTRHRRLQRLDCFFKGTEYVHLEHNWDGRKADNYETISPDVILPYGFTQPANDIPVSQRRPTAPLRLTPRTVNRFTGLLFSTNRSPRVAVEGDPDAEDFLQAVFAKADFWQTMYLARTFGGSMGSVLVTVQLRRGRFSYTATSPKCVQDILWEDPDLKIPAGVLIQYPFTKEVEILDERTGALTGRVQQVHYLYRRIIDAQWDMIFEPARIVGGKIPGEMAIDWHASYEHRLGRFPGVWIFNLPSDDEMDGVPDCDGAFQMFDTIDRQISQSNKGLLFNQDPTLVYGRDRKFEMSGIPIQKGSENALNVGLGGFAQYLEISGSGIQQALELIRFLRNEALETVQAPSPDPEKMSGAAQSAVAIELLNEPTLEKADRLRQQYGRAIVTLGEATLELGRLWSDPNAYDVNVRQVKYDLPPRLVELDAQPNDPTPEAGRRYQLVPRSPGIGGIVSLKWGSYFQETPQEKQTKVAIYTTAHTAGFIDLETAVRRVAMILEIDDVEGLLRKVREEAAEKQAAFLESFAQEQLANRPPEPPAPAPDPTTEVDMANRMARAQAKVAPIEALEGKPAPEGEPLAKVQKASDVALNGAQVQAAKELILEVAAQKLPRETGINMLVNFFNIDPADAERVMGPVGKTFFIQPDDPAAEPASPGASPV